MATADLIMLDSAGGGQASKPGQASHSQAGTEQIVLKDVEAAATALSTCFDKDGDCIVAVVADASQAVASEEESVTMPPAKRRVVAQYRVWSRILCAWSDVFTAMLTHDVKERAQGRIEISDFSAVAVEVLLRFLYSGTLQATGMQLIEVDMLADKYCIKHAKALCAKGLAKALTPETACDMLEEACRVGSAAVQTQSLDIIYREPERALKNGFLLETSRLEEVLKSTLLCMGDYELATVLLGWASTKGAERLDIPVLLEQHVHLGSVTEERYAKLHHAATLVGCTVVIERLWQKSRRGKPTTDYFATLSTMHEKEREGAGTAASSTPFLGYWINLIPSSPSWHRFAGSQSSHLVELQKLARNTDVMKLQKDESMMWYTPHHSVYVSGISFRQPVSKSKSSEDSITVGCSENGSSWQTLFDSKLHVEGVSGGLVIPCRSSGCAHWFKLSVQGGCYANQLYIHGIVQST